VVVIEVTQEDRHGGPRAALPSGPVGFPLDAIRGPSWPARAFARLSAPRTAPGPVVRVHGWVYRVSGGRLGHGVFGAPVLLLHTTGRRSGKRRSTPLVYGTDKGALIVVASNRGGDQAPHWLLNLQANPHVEVWLARHKANCRAHIVEPGDAEFDRLWTLMDQVNFGRYTRLQAASTRPMPIIVISLVT
jgi:F420H(2)-dependent quinone reductase